MKRKLLLILMLSLSIYAFALKVCPSDAPQMNLSYQSLNAEKLSEFTTQRNKNGKDIRENWQGIALLPWLQSLGISEWHSLKCVSYDGYEVELQRVELDNMPAFLALYHENEAIPEQDLRIIFPQTRENLWLRGVSQIVLQAYQPQPHPRYIYPWEDTKDVFGWNNGELSISELMSKAFAQSKGSLIMVDRELHPLALEYPALLADKALVESNSGSIRLKGITRVGDSPLAEIVYLQCGPFAYVKKGCLSQLTELGMALGWDWTDIRLTSLKNTNKKIQDRQKAIKLGKETYLELR